MTDRLKTLRRAALAILALALCAPLAAPSIARADPPADGGSAFGITMGASVRKLEGARVFKPGWYKVAAPPKPDPRFTQVAVEAFADTGVCVVQAVSPEVIGDPAGVKIRSTADRLADDFSRTYGAPERLDSCSNAACAADLWGEDMQAGARRYGYRWEMHDAPDKGVREASLVVIPHSVSSYVLLLQFDSGALTPCQMAERQALDEEQR
ncbi:MAG TPA: hypothetical protein VGM25_02545 [Caulobacteraceae bacterium]